MVTRLGLYGGSRGLYGSFTGKAIFVAIGKYRGFISNISRLGLR